MKRHRTFPFRVTALAVCLGLAEGITQGLAQTQETALFNGKDLTGWQVKCQPADQGKTFWRVDNGTLLCDSMGRKDHNYVWLVSEREFGNFELKLRFQAYKDSPGNSGLQFRSRFDDTFSGGWMNGPQVDIHPPAAMAWRTGKIYDETREERRWISPSLKDATMDPKLKPAHYVFKYVDDGDGWNELTLVCDGLQIKTMLNGVIMTDWNGSGVLDNDVHAKHHVGRTGHFALQLHAGDELRIRFKDLTVRPL